MRSGCQACNFIKERTQHWCLQIHYKIGPANIRLDEDVLKTYFVFVFRRHLQDVLIKTNIIVLVIRLQDVFKTSSRYLQNVFRTSSRSLAKMCSRHLQDDFKAFSRQLQDIFKTFWRRFEDVLQRSLQDVFKTYHQVKLFLLTRFQNDTYSTRLWDVLQRRLSKKDLPSSHFWEIYGQCTDFVRVVKVSQILVSHFTTPFRDHFQRCI